MKEKSINGRILMILGIIVGLVIWFRGLVFSVLRGLWKMISGESVPQPGVGASRSGEVTKHAAPDATDRPENLIQAQDGAGSAAGEPTPVEPDIESGEDTVVQEFGHPNDDLTRRQHGSLGGVPTRDDFRSSAEGDTRPSNAGTSGEDVELTDTDETDRGRNVPLDEGIPNLGEPGDVEDVGPETETKEAIVEEVESGVPEEYGEDQDIDSITYDEPWIAHIPGEDEGIPAASRGYLEYGEASDEEADSEDVDALDEFGPSGAGGEEDLENDELPAWEDSDFTIVDNPDEPLSYDEVDVTEDEPTLGLRDSESLAPDVAVSDDIEAETAEYDATTLGEQDDESQAGYSAAWSTPAEAPGDAPQVIASPSMGGDPADLASAAAAGDLGTVTNRDSHQAAEESEADNSSTPRKSRKQRRVQSDWVPQGAVKGDGNPVCPVDFPIKGNASSRIYHRPTDPSYGPTIPEYCFATEEDAQKAGFRAPKGQS